jgi:hypothetical protein
MRILRRSGSIPAMAALWLAAAGASFAAAKDEPATPYVHADGTLIRDEQNRPLHLRGVNLGGWLCWECWIFGGGFESQSTILERLSSLTGAEAAAAFRDAVHARFIAEPQPWRDLIRWIAKRWFARRPTPEEAAAAIREFLDAAACDRTSEDPQMRNALQPPHRDGPAPKGAERPPAAQGAPR